MSAETPDMPETDPQAVAAGLLKEMEEEIRRLKEEHLRALAEAENIRKRAERSLADERQYGISKFARDLLSVADNLRRAVETAPAGARGEPAAAAILTGVELTEKDMLAIFERHGVKKIVPKGEAFNPNFHQAIAEVPVPGVPKGQIVDVVQAGYVLGDRLLRAAMVAVAKGEAAPSAPAAPPGATIDTKA
jgi:molecular chaperone GrpE